MGTTVLVSERTRARLAAARDALGVASIDEAIDHVLRAATPTAAVLFKQHKAAVREVCRRHGIKRLVAHGSRVRDDRAPGSDLDLVARFPTGTGLFEVMRIQDELTAAFGVQVDLGSEPPPGSRLAKHIRDEGVVLI